MTDTPLMSLPLLAPAQAQKHVTVNEALRLLDGMVQLSVLDRTRTAPRPARPTAIAIWWLRARPASVEGWDLNIAFWIDGAWIRLVPRPGWLTWIVAEATFLVWNGTDWVDIAASGSGSESAFSDADFNLLNDADPTKKALFSLSGSPPARPGPSRCRTPRLNWQFLRARRPSAATRLSRAR
jgi:Protein of unknown function (DUF2793).